MAHDEATWNFLMRFLTWSQSRPEFAWMSLPQLLGVTASISVIAPVLAIAPVRLAS
jgi:hypothetical protein